MSNSQADSMIESGQPLKELAMLFPARVAAYEYFAREMTQRFASAARSCATCGQQCEGQPLAFTWRANLHTTRTVLLSFMFTALAIFAHHLYSRWVVVEFTTFHRLCSRCRRRHRTRSIAVAVLHKVLFAILILLLLVTVPLVIFLFVAIFAAPDGTWMMVTGSALGLALLGVVAWGFEVCRRLLIPDSLRQIGRFPFFLYGVRDVA
jgi:uncharacterized membrane protein